MGLGEDENTMRVRNGAVSVDVVVVDVSIDTNAGASCNSRVRVNQVKKWISPAGKVILTAVTYPTESLASAR